VEHGLQEERGWTLGGFGGQTDGFVVAGLQFALGYHQICSLPPSGSCECIWTDPLEDTYANFPLKVCINFVLPVDWDECWLVDDHWFGIGVHMKLQGLTIHDWQWLMLTHIERRCTIVAEKPDSFKASTFSVANNLGGKVVCIRGGSWLRLGQEQMDSSSSSTEAVEAKTRIGGIFGWPYSTT
jgi:hypothetical protein